MQESIVFFFFLSLAIAAYYALVLLPRQRAFKKHQSYVLSMHVGDEVITYSGIIAIITELDEEVGVARVKLAEGLEVRMLTAAIMRPYDAQEIAENARMALEARRANE
ncbi:MAG: preprotein translocase subunit YajC [Anaerolineae bacterium]|nr:preprotein translocase subunit YajC [Anaerolineae bacterium]